MHNNKINYYLIYIKKIKYYKYNKFKTENIPIKFRSKLNYITNFNYYFYELLLKDTFINKFLNFFLKKGKKQKYFFILKKVLKYIKIFLRQHPILFLKKSLFFNKFSYFDVFELHLKKRVIYIPKVINSKKQLNFSFKLIIKKMWLFIKFLEKERSYWYNSINDLYSIHKKIAFYFILSYYFNTNKQIIDLYNKKFTEISYGNRFKLLKNVKYKFKKRRKQNAKLIRQRWSRSVQFSWKNSMDFFLMKERKKKKYLYKEGTIKFNYFFNYDNYFINYNSFDINNFFNLLGIDYSNRRIHGHQIFEQKKKKMIQFNRIRRYWQKKWSI